VRDYWGYFASIVEEVEAPTWVGQKLGFVQFPKLLSDQCRGGGLPGYPSSKK
jgi:hypothetical protein